VNYEIALSIHRGNHYIYINVPLILAHQITSKGVTK